MNSAEGYQARAFSDEPGAVAASTDRSLKQVARSAKREAARRRPSMWDKALGPFYNVSQVSELLERSEDEVLAMVVDRTVIGLTTVDSALVFPSFQFEGPPELRDNLATAFRELKTSGIDDWTAAGWLVAHHAELDHRSVVDWLLDDEPAADVHWLARDAAQRYSR